MRSNFWKSILITWGSWDGKIWFISVNLGLCGEIVLISFCELICGELHAQYPDACQNIELGSPFINDYGQHLHFQNIAVISSMVLRTEFNYSKNDRNIWHDITYKNQVIWNTAVITNIDLASYQALTPSTSIHSTQTIICREHFSKKEVLY